MVERGWHVRTICVFYQACVFCGALEDGSFGGGRTHQQAGAQRRARDVEHGARTLQEHGDHQQHLVLRTRSLAHAPSSSPSKSEHGQGHHPLRRGASEPANMSGRRLSRSGDKGSYVHRRQRDAHEPLQSQLGRRHLGRHERHRGTAVRAEACQPACTAAARPSAQDGWMTSKRRDAVVACAIQHEAIVWCSVAPRGCEGSVPASWVDPAPRRRWRQQSSPSADAAFCRA